jgi:putative oxidoreductase
MSLNSAAAGSAGSSNGISAALLAGRVLLSAMFILAGFAKLTAISGTAAWFGSLGIPLPTMTTVLVGLIELVGGLAVLAGFHTRIAGLALAAFTLAATAIAHFDFTDQMQVLLLQKNLAVVGGFLVLAVAGPGGLSFDGRRD